MKRRREVLAATIAWVTVLAMAGAAQAITIETVPVGNPGNVDDRGYGGSVAYAYNLGKYEVTGAQYAAFLNAVASTDTNGLYNILQSGPLGADIVQSGAPGSYTYAAGYPNRPVSGVSWLNAARFCNWMHNGQPNGAQDASTTEDGVYDVSGGYSTAVRKPGATWMLPTKDEWIKAGYYDPARGGMNMYPTSDTISWGDYYDWGPIASVPGPGTNLDNTRNVVGTAVDVGSYPNVPGTYGTFNQSGNVAELIETTNSPSWKLTAGSHFASASSTGSYLGSCYHLEPELWPGDALNYVGFRLVELGVFEDDDGDGVANSQDICPGSDPNFPVDQNGCLDTDDDGVADANDLCGGTPAGGNADANGCADDDADGVYDYIDLCLGTPPGATVDEDGCSDSDGDGVYDYSDNCPDACNPGQVNSDTDGFGDVCDNCPTLSSSDQDDSDGDGMGNPCDECDGTPAGHSIDPCGCSDYDSDGVRGQDDNCPIDGNPGQEDNADGDGVGDECDLCPSTDPQWQVTEEGCADRDADGVSDYRDQCPGSDPEFPVNEVGCRSRRFFRVLSTPVAIAKVWNDWRTPVSGGNDFVVEVRIGGWNELEFNDAGNEGRAFFSAQDDGHAELWTEGHINEFASPGESYFYEILGYPTDACSTVTYDMGYAPFDGITITAYEVFDGDHDGVIDADDNCAGTPVGTVIDPCNPGCPAADSDGDGVPNDYWVSAYYDLCPGSDPCYPVDIDGCLDSDRDGSPDTGDQCPGTVLGATVSIEGCHDSDDDGVPVPYDQCPDTPGGNPVNDEGCTDTDGDGVPDTDDSCADPCGWVDENGCPDRDLDGVRDSSDSCPDTSPVGSQVCPDGCVNASDADGDGVWDCDELCPGTAGGTPVNSDGCPDDDQDGVTDDDDFCPGSPENAVVDPCGCHTKEIIVETDGPLWQFEISNINIGATEPYLIYPPLVSSPGGGVTHSMTFGDLEGIANATSCHFQVYTTGIVQLWVADDVANWNKVHARAGGCPLTGERREISGPMYDWDPCPHPTTASRIRVEACPLCPSAHQGGFDILAAENIDTDGDGVQDPIDQCPDSDPNLIIGEDGCVYVPVCGDLWHPSPIADIDVDCYVGPNDVVKMAEQWLDCVHPLDADCMQLQPSPEQLYPDIMYMPYCGAKSIDGLLTDWTDPCWVILDQIYAGNPNDLTSAKYTVCWDPCEDKLYSAIVVEDACQIFESSPTNWHTCDRAEIYVQADPNGGDQWGSNTAEAPYDKAQQYVVGYQGITQGWAWAVFGHGTYIPGDFEPHNAQFTDAGRVSGNTITYEISAKAWQWYGGISPEDDPNVVRQLEPGVQVGFDVTVGSRWGPAPHDDNEEYGMLSANAMAKKFIYAENFQRWELLDYEGNKVPPECGDWGMLRADINSPSDCYVDMGDFMEMTMGWMDCTNPQSPCLYKPTQPF